MTFLMANFWLVVSCSIILTIMKHNLLHCNLLLWFILTISDVLEAPTANGWGIRLITMLRKDWNSWGCVVTARLFFFFCNKNVTSEQRKYTTIYTETWSLKIYYLFKRGFFFLVDTSLHVMVLDYTGRFLQIYTTHWAWAPAYTYVRWYLGFLSSYPRHLKEYRIL